MLRFTTHHFKTVARTHYQYLHVSDKLSRPVQVRSQAASYAKDLLPSANFGETKAMATHITTVRVAHDKLGRIVSGRFWRKNSQSKIGFARASLYADILPS